MPRKLVDSFFFTVALYAHLVWCFLYVFHQHFLYLILQLSIVWIIRFSLNLVQHGNKTTSIDGDMKLGYIITYPYIAFVAATISHISNTSKMRPFPPSRIPCVGFEFHIILLAPKFTVACNRKQLLRLSVTIFC